MEDDPHQPDEMNSQMRVMKTYLKSRYSLSDLLRVQKNDCMTNNLKKGSKMELRTKVTWRETVTAF